jgi:arylsulfatase
MKTKFKSLTGLISRIFALFIICAVSINYVSAAIADPNIIIIFADDLGYADIGCFGAKKIKTPNLDKMAKEGIRFTEFYVAQPVCSASRAALLTGCYPSRVGIFGALGPSSKIGINSNEVTIAELVKQKGYATAIFGKWHLGHHKPFLPIYHGFDEYFGLPYSNDMWPYHPEAKPGSYPPLQLIENDHAVITNVTAEEQKMLTTWYTGHAVKFIEKNKDRPFFLYLAHSMPHVPLFVSDKFRGKSKAGLYGDVIMEIDWSVGQILETLKRCNLDQKTLVIFTSDNGPWLSYGNHAGSAYPLREGKGTVWEGGVRVPFIARFPGVIPPGKVCKEPAMTIDLFPTIANLIGATLPTNKIDGMDIFNLLTAKPGAKSPHEAFFFYYNANELQAVRSNKWKLILPHTYKTLQGVTPGKDGIPARYKTVKIEKPELYDLKKDPSEIKNVADKYPDIVQNMMKLVERCRQELGDNLTKQKGEGVRPPGRIEN